MFPLDLALGAGAPGAGAVASPLQQAVGAAAGLVLKPAYMLLALVLGAWLQRSADPHLRLVRLGLWAFLAGEVACAADYLLGATGDLLEAVHALGMAAAAALVALGLFDLLDARLWHLTAPDVACTASRLCGRCWKREPVPCGAQRIALAALPGLMLAAALPLTAELTPRVLTLDILGSPVDYGLTPGLLWLEFRLLPAVALLLLAVALGLVARGATGLRPARPWFAAGLGAALFALFRLALTYPHAAMPVWSDFWEEATELAAVAGLAVFLWTWRAALGLSREAPDGAGASAR